MERIVQGCRRHCVASLDHSTVCHSMADLEMKAELVVVQKQTCIMLNSPYILRAVYILWQANQLHPSAQRCNSKGSLRWCVCPVLHPVYCSLRWSHSKCLDGLELDATLLIIHSMTFTKLHWPGGVLSGTGLGWQAKLLRLLGLQHWCIRLHTPLDTTPLIDLVGKTVHVCCQSFL